MENLRKHRLYRHNELTYGSGDAPLLTQISQKDLANTASSSAVVNDPVVKTNSLPHSSSGEWLQGCLQVGKRGGDPRRKCLQI